MEFDRSGSRAVALLRELWTLKTRIAEATQQEDFPALTSLSKEKHCVQESIKDLHVCGCCGIQRLGLVAMELSVETWYGTRCGFCGKDAPATEVNAIASVHSRIVMELKQGNELVKETSSKYKRRFINAAITAAEHWQRDFQSKTKKLRAGAKQLDPVVFVGHLQRTRSIIAAHGWGKPDVYQIGIDDLLKLLGAE